MRKIVVLLIFLISTSYVFSQKTYVKKVDESNLLTEEGWIQNGLKKDYWFYYHSNGEVRSQGHYKNNLKEGFWKYYSVNKIIEKEGHFTHGEKVNWWVFYTKNGTLNYKCQLKNNLKNGYCLIYLKDKIVRIEKYIDDKKIDEWTDLKSFKKENNLSDLN